jgi:hypothetical protein
VPSACLSATWGAAPPCRSISGWSSTAVRGAIVARAGRRSESLLSSPSGTSTGRLCGTVADGVVTCNVRVIPPPGQPASVRAVDRDGEGCADRPHARVGQPSEPFDEDRDGDALDRVHVDHATAGYRVLAGLEPDVADEAADRGGARCDECAPVSWDHRVGRGRRPGGARSRPSRTTRPHRARAVSS